MKMNMVGEIDDGVTTDEDFLVVDETDLHADGFQSHDADGVRTNEILDVENIGTNVEEAQLEEEEEEDIEKIRMERDRVAMEKKIEDLHAEMSSILYENSRFLEDSVRLKCEIIKLMKEKEELGLKIVELENNNEILKSERAYQEAARRNRENIFMEEELMNDSVKHMMMKEVQEMQNIEEKLESELKETVLQLEEQKRKVVEIEHEKGEMTKTINEIQEASAKKVDHKMYETVCAFANGYVAEIGRLREDKKLLEKTITELHKESENKVDMHFYDAICSFAMRYADEISIIHQEKKDSVKNFEEAKIRLKQETSDEIDTVRKETADEIERVHRETAEEIRSIRQEKELLEKNFEESKIRLEQEKIDEIDRIHEVNADIIVSLLKEKRILEVTYEETERNLIQRITEVQHFSEGLLEEKKEIMAANMFSQKALQMLKNTAEIMCGSGSKGVKINAEEELVFDAEKKLDYENGVQAFRTELEAIERAFKNKKVKLENIEHQLELFVTWLFYVASVLLAVLIFYTLFR